MPIAQSGWRFFLMALALSLMLPMASACGVGGGGGGGGDDDDPIFGDDHPRIYLSRNRERLLKLISDGAPSWSRFKAVVDRQLANGNVYDFRAWHAALVGQLTGDARYCDLAVEQVEEHVSEAEVVIAADGSPEVAHDSYLEVGRYVGDLAITYDWCFPQTTVDQRRRWLAFATQAVWNVWNYEDATWGDWSGWSVNNPSNNYYYSFLRATMMLGLAAHDEIPEAAGWLTKFRDEKIEGQLIPTFARDLIGGGSREGTGYGVAMKNLFELYDFWHGSTGEQLATKTPHARASMLHMMHSTVPTLDRVAPIGDHSRDQTAEWFDYHRQYLLTLTHLFKDDPIAPLATDLLNHSSVPMMDDSSQFMFVYDFLYTTAITPRPIADMGKAYYAAGAGQLFARSSWDVTATWINFIAGAYTESHAHQDQGSFMIYKDRWLAYDGVVNSMSGLSQMPEAHSLLRFVNAGTTVRQREPTTSKMETIARGPGWVHAAGDLTASFGSESPVNKWQREVVFLEPDCLVVYDRTNVASGVEQVWQLVAPTGFTVNSNRATTTNGHQLTVQRLLPAGASGAARVLTPSGDNPGGFRYDETSTGTATRHLHVLWLNNATTNVTAADSGGLDGVAITLANGRIATVRFSPSAIGGTLEIRGGGANVDATLGAGIATLPELE